MRITRWLIVAAVFLFGISFFIPAAYDHVALALSGIAGALTALIIARPHIKEILATLDKIERRRGEAS